MFEALLGFLGLISLPLLSLISGGGHRPITIAAGFLLLFVMTLLLGGLFPLAGKLYAGPLRLFGKSIGNVYSANTAGSVLGSFLAGFVLIPSIGTAGTLLLIAALNLLVAGSVAGLSLRPLNTRWLVGRARRSWQWGWRAGSAETGSRAITSMSASVRTSG